jgi:hypothetical protein
MAEVVESHSISSTLKQKGLQTRQPVNPFLSLNLNSVLRLDLSSTLRRVDEESCWSVAEIPPPGSYIPIHRGCSDRNFCLSHQSDKVAFHKIVPTNLLPARLCAAQLILNQTRKKQSLLSVQYLFGTFIIGIAHVGNTGLLGGFPVT